MSKTILVPACITTILASGLFAAYATFDYSRGVEADRHYMTYASQLESAALNAITTGVRASTDTSYIGQMERYAAQVGANIAAIRKGDPSISIPPAPNLVDIKLRALEDTWFKALHAVEEIAKSKGSNTEFSRQAEELRTLVEQLAEQAEVAVSSLDESGRVNDKAMATIIDELDKLLDGTSLLRSGDAVTSESVRQTLEAVTSYLSVLGQAGNVLPRDPALLKPLIDSFKTGQQAHRVATTATRASAGTVDNSVHSRVLWAEKQNIETTLKSLQSSIQSLPSTRMISPIIAIASVVLTLVIVLLCCMVILREAQKRTRQAEQAGMSIQSSQKERSNELHQLFAEMERVRTGDLTTEFTTKLSSTHEIATILNSVFSQFRGLFKDVQQTIVSLSAASEQTLTMARNVNRNRQEQDSAIQHITKQNEELGHFIRQTETLAIHTKDASQQVAQLVTTGSTAVHQVHEGVVKISQSNMMVMHHTKAMTEHIQSLERLVDVVRKVANQSSTVSQNAFLVADAIADEGLSTRISRSATTMQQLASSANEAVEQIEISLRGINEAAKDTQFVLDDTQKEITELTGRSRNALESLTAISGQSAQLAESILTVTEQTAQLQSRSAQVSETMNSINHYASENSAASEQTASAISNLNQQAQQVGETLAQFKV